MPSWHVEGKLHLAFICWMTFTRTGRMKMMLVLVGDFILSGVECKQLHTGVQELTEQTVVKESGELLE
jgi:hypothetical protein